MLRDEVKLFERLSGESANDVTIVRLGSFLDGYFVGKEESVIHAHWITDDNEQCYCSACMDKHHRPMFFKPHPQWRHCPWCGAKMDEVAENG